MNVVIINILFVSGFVNFLKFVIKCWFWVILLFVKLVNDVIVKMIVVIIWVIGIVVLVYIICF